MKAKFVNEAFSDVFLPKHDEEIRNIVQNSFKKQLSIQDRASILKLSKGNYNFNPNSNKFPDSKDWKSYHDLLIMLDENGYEAKPFGNLGKGPTTGYSDYINGESEEEKRTYTWQGVKIARQGGIWINYKVKKILDNMDFFFHDSFSDEDPGIGGSMMLTELIPNSNNLKYNCSISITNDGTWKAGFSDDEYFSETARIYKGEEDQLLSNVAQKLVQAEFYAMNQILKLQNYAKNW